MKIRNGFVSNSSSSSFIVFGFKVNRENIILDTNKDECIEEMLEERNLEFIPDDDCFYIGEHYYIGEEGIEEFKQMSQNEIIKLATVVNDVLVEKVSTKDFKIYCGTIYNY